VIAEGHDTSSAAEKQVSMDVTDATFDTAVIARSTQVPVVVDLWAAWCGPCRTLGPILEKVVAGTGGAVELAKVDIDSNPQVAAAFQVQSIPAVYALRDGKVVDHFIGALPEAAVRAFVDQLAPAPSEADMLVAKGDEGSLRRALELEPAHTGAVVALAELLTERGEGEEALALLARVPETAEVRRVAALARLGGPAVAVDDDVDARLDALLAHVKEDGGARQEYVDLLEAMGPDDPRTARYRKALTARLF
jgi:putative thioredoxin